MDGVRVKLLASSGRRWALFVMAVLLIVTLCECQNSPGEKTDASTRPITTAPSEYTAATFGTLRVKLDGKGVTVGSNHVPTAEILDLGGRAYTIPVDLTHQTSLEIMLESAPSEASFARCRSRENGPPECVKNFGETNAVGMWTTIETFDHSMLGSWTEWLESPSGVKTSYLVYYVVGPEPQGVRPCPSQEDDLAIWTVGREVRLRTAAKTRWLANCEAVHYTHRNRDHGGTGNLLRLSTVWADYTWMGNSLQVISLNKSWKGKTCEGFGIGTKLKTYLDEYDRYAIAERPQPKELGEGLAFREFSDSDLKTSVWIVRYRLEFQPNYYIHLFHFDLNMVLDRVVVGVGAPVEMTLKFVPAEYHGCPKD